MQHIHNILPCTVAAHVNTYIDSEGSAHLHKAVPGDKAIVMSDFSQISRSMDISSILECLFY